MQACRAGWCEIKQQIHFFHHTVTRDIVIYVKLVNKLLRNLGKRYKHAESWELRWCEVEQQKHFFRMIATA